MINQSAAYDLLSHKHFAEKLKLYNFDEASVNWCKSYLGGRTQCVQVESNISDYLECEESGALQGSILAGLFHIINSNKKGKVWFMLMMALTASMQDTPTNW